MRPTKSSVIFLILLISIVFYLFPQNASDDSEINDYFVRQYTT